MVQQVPQVFADTTRHVNRRRGGINGRRSRRHHGGEVVQQTAESVHGTAEVTGARECGISHHGCHAI
jgi:hypothetical protein